MQSLKTARTLCGCAAVLICILSAGCSRTKESEPEEYKDSIFSWSEGYIHPEREQELVTVMEQLGCRAVYQEIPKDADEDVVADYLKRRKSHNQEVWFLSGDAGWGMETDAESMLKEVDRAASFNNAAKGKGEFTGIVWDVEPYLLDEWKDDPEGLMEQYVDNCRAAYKKAKEAGFSVIVCIPYYYEKEGLGGQLEQLIKNGSDAVAVMNYNKEDEAAQIQFEVETAQKHGKGIIHIAELQEPGNHGLKEHNTYYHDGIDAVRKSFEKLKERYPYEKLACSWHYMSPALELLEKEKDQ